VGCGSIKGSYASLSLLPYDLQISPDTYGPTIKSSAPILTQGNDAVFGRLVDSLFNDLGYVQSKLACKPADSASTPLSPETCATLATKWAEARYKLNVCLASAFEPIAGHGSTSRDSNHALPSGRPYCTEYFPQRLAAFRNALPAAPAGTDVANRLGALKSRVDILQHVYATRFLPSIPECGFCRERTATSSDGRNPPAPCVAPW
jgi:hypothetical protein